MKCVTGIFCLLVFCATFASAQSTYLNGDYFWCPAPNTNRVIAICNPTDGAHVTGVLPIAAAVRDTDWPITVEIDLNGRAVYGPLQPSSEDISTSITLDPVSTAQSVRVLVTNSHGAGYYAQFTAYNQLTPPCTPSSTDPSIVMCSPANNATLTSPFQVSATATDSNSNYLDWVIYLDGHPLAGQQFPNGVNGHDFATSLQSYTGKHRLTVQAHEQNGSNTFQATAYVNITAPAGCAPTLPGPGVTMCTLENSPSQSSLHIVAKAYDNYTIKWMQIYVDGHEAYTARNASIDTFVPISQGKHRVTVRETNYAGSGQTYSTTEYITVP